MIITKEMIPPPPSIEEIDFEKEFSQLKDMFRSELQQAGYTWDAMESDPISLLLRAIAYRIILLKAEKNKLIRDFSILYAEGAALDNIAAQWGEQRLSGSKGYFYAKVILSSPITIKIPAGLICKSTDDKMQAHLAEDLQIVDRDWFIAKFIVDSPIDSSINGTITDWVLQTSFSFVIGMEQTEAITGAGAPETDDEFRQRIMLLPDALSVAGPESAYKYFALSANEHVKDVAVFSPEPTKVHIYILSDEGDGTPAPELCSEIEQYLMNEQIRPLTDIVSVLPISVVQYSLHIVIFFYPSTKNIDEKLTEIYAKLEVFTYQYHRIGFDITKTKIYGIIDSPYIQKADIFINGKEEDLIISENQAAYCTEISCEFGGYNV